MRKKVSLVSLAAILIIAMAGQSFAGGFRRGSTSANAAATSSSSSSASVVNRVNITMSQQSMGRGGHRGGRGGGFWPAFAGGVAGAMAVGIMNGYSQPVCYGPQPYVAPMVYPQQVVPVQYEQPQPRGWVKQEAEWYERVYDPSDGRCKVIKRKVTRLVPVY
jgi:hypothetical protein